MASLRRESRRFSFKILKRNSLTHENFPTLHIDIPDSVSEASRRSSLSSLASVPSQFKEKPLNPITLHFDDKTLENDFSEKYNAFNYPICKETARQALMMEFILLIGELHTGILSTSVIAVIIALLKRGVLVLILMSLLNLARSDQDFFMENLQFIELVVYSAMGIIMAVTMICIDWCIQPYEGEFVKGSHDWHESFSRPFEPVSGFVCSGYLLLYLGLVFSLTTMQFTTRFLAGLPTVLWILMTETSALERVSHIIFALCLIFTLAYGEYKAQKQMRQHWLLENELMSDTKKYEALLKEILPVSVKKNLEKSMRTERALSTSRKNSRRGSRVFSDIEDQNSETSTREAKPRPKREARMPSKLNLVKMDSIVKDNADLVELLPTSCRYFPEVSVLFCYISGFSELVQRKPPLKLVRMLNSIFSKFDHVINHHQVYKMEAIAQTYLLASGCPIPCADHSIEICKAALDMQRLCKIGAFGSDEVRLKIGINTGPVAAGVVGSRASKYQLFGDTVNTASRMASSCPIGQIQLSMSAYMSCLDVLSRNALDKAKQIPLQFRCRGEIPVKGKGMMKTYYLSNPEEKNIKQSKGGTRTLSPLRYRKRAKSNGLSSPRNKPIVHSGSRYRAPLRREKAMMNVDDKSQHTERERFGEDSDEESETDEKQMDLQVHLDVESLTLRFLDPDLESEFVFDMWESTRSNVRATCAAAVGTVVAAEAMNLLVFHSHAQWVVSTAILSSTALMCLPSFAEFIAKRFSPEIGEIALAMIFSVLVVTSILQTFQEVSTLKFLIGYTFAMQTLHFRIGVAVVVCGFAFIVIFSAAYIEFKSIQIPKFATMTIYISVVAFLLSMVGIYRREEAERRRFVLRKMVAARRDELLAILGRMMPDPSIAKALLHDQEVALPLKDVTYLYSDIKGFTKLSSKLHPIETVTLLNQLYSAFDSHLDERSVFKIDTIGDAYVVVGGLRTKDSKRRTSSSSNATDITSAPTQSRRSSLLSVPDQSKILHADAIMSFAFDMLQEINSLVENRAEHPILSRPELKELSLGMRIGVHSGSGIGGVLGKKKPRFFIWGMDTLVAEGIESSGALNIVHCSAETVARLANPQNYNLAKCPKNPGVYEHSSQMRKTYFAHYDKKCLEVALARRKKSVTNHS